MSEEEKIKLALILAKNGIDLEKNEQIVKDIYECLKSLITLTEKNKKIIDKYIKDKE